jgi:hypothetical protein
MELPEMVAKDEKDDQELWFARNGAGKELFFWNSRNSSISANG